MMFLRKNWIHFAIWGGMFLYLIFARDLYNNYFLKVGKPVFVNTVLPTRNEKINSHIDLFEPTVYEGEYVYSVVGWSFSKANRNIATEDYDRQIVLVSDKMNYFFPVESYPRPDVQKSFQAYGSKLTNSGFRAKISPGMIRPGVYQIGFVFHNPVNGKSYYSLMNKYLIRTPNQLKVSDKAPAP